MDNIIVSVVVPVYKVELFLQDCINSILQQKFRYFELLLIDDGSPDRSGSICDVFAKIDSRVKVYHKENGGLSDARNYGLMRSQGEYITYIDSDDMVSADYLSTMIAIANKYEVDYVQVGYTKDWAELNSGTDNVVLFPGGEVALKRLLLYKEMYEASWGKLYSRDLARRILFPVGRLYEDVLTAYKFAYCCSSFASCDTKLYYYRVNNAGIMHRKLDISRFSSLTVFDEIRNFLGSSYKFFENEVFYYRFRHELNVYNDCISSDFDDSQVCEELRLLRADILYSYTHTSYHNELKYVALFYLLNTFPYLYCLLVRTIRGR